MNTCIEYLYRDASNYKKWQCAVIQGEFTEEQKQTIRDSLIDGEYFYPAQVGLPEERLPGHYDDDPDWFEFCEENFELTTATPTVWLTPKELAENFFVACIDWGNDAYANRNEQHQPTVTVVIYNGIIDSVLTNVPGLDVTIIDYDDDIGSTSEMLDGAIEDAKKAGQENVSYYLDHCTPAKLNEEEEGNESK